MKVLISFYSVKHFPAETKKKRYSICHNRGKKLSKYLEQYDVCFGVHLVTFSRLLSFYSCEL